MQLGSYCSNYSPGRSFIVRVAWYFCSLLLFEGGWLPISRPKLSLLRLFGATVGRGVVVKPNVRIKFPWKLRVGENTWIGQEVWIDNLAEVTIGDNCCLSQGVYLCTGSHDHQRTTFDLVLGSITIESQCWIASKSVVLPGVRVGEGAVVAAGSVVVKNVDAGTIVGGCPATAIGSRQS